MKVVARFSNKPAAETFVKSKDYAEWCVMGHRNWEYDKHNINQTKLVILDSVDDFAASEAEELKAKALAKLTMEERKALGV